MRRGLLLVGVLLLAGCSLPLPQGVQAPGAVTAEQAQPRDISVLPPGPRAGASPAEVVTGFLGAQVSGEGRHAVARAFLAPRAAWDDGDGVLVYAPVSLDVNVNSADLQPLRASVTVTFTATGQVQRDGGYGPPASPDVTETYAVERTSQSTPWQLTSVPGGLRLTSSDLGLALRARRTYYLGAPVAVTRSGQVPRLVPDLVRLPVGDDPASAVVHRLLLPPTAALGTSVTSAAPTGTTARSVQTSAAGVVAVDLDLPRGAPPLSDPARQALSAQLVWSLRSLGTGFTGLRLSVGGAPLVVPGEGAVQGASDWDAYDPDGIADDAPLLYLADRRLRAAVPVRGLRTPSPLPGVDADEAAVAPDLSRVAVLTRRRGGTVLHVGTFSALGTPVLTGALSSPSWGSGDRGLWLLRGGAEVLLVGPDRRVQSVPLEQPLVGRLTHLAVSRDGGRVALVAGGRLYVGRVDDQLGALRVRGLVPVVPALTGATSVAWQSADTVVVVGTVQTTPLAARVVVDGSSVDPLEGPGLPGAPVQVAAGPGAVWVTSLDSPLLFRAVGRGFAPGATGGFPFFPG